MTAFPPPSPTVEQKRVRLFWILFPVAYLGLAVVTSVNALFGSWTVRAFGVDYYYNWDPDGFYIASGINLFAERYVGYIGHPGLTLMLLVFGVAKTCHLAGGLWGPPVPYDLFCARNIALIILLVKTAVAAVHLLSFGLLYRIARIFVNRTAAVTAVLAYATTAVVLYYQTKVSPEPLMVLFTLLALLSCWKYVEHHRHGRGYAFLLLAALATAAALASKVLIVAPLVLFIPLYLLCHPGMRGRDKLLGIGSFGIATAMALAVFLGKLDLQAFFGHWTRYGPGTQPLEGHWLTYLRDEGFLLVPLIREVVAVLSPSAWMPGLADQRGQFNAAETGFVILSLAGLGAYLRRRPEKRRQVLWLLLFLTLLTPLVVFKGAHHYYVLHFALLAIFFGHGLGLGLGRLVRRPGHHLGPALLATLLVHAFALALYVDIRRGESVAYRTWWAPYYEALGRLGYGERVALLGGKAQEEVRDRLIAYYAVQTTPFAKAFQDCFVVVAGRPSPQAVAERRIRAIITRTGEGVTVERLPPPFPPGAGGQAGRPSPGEL